MSAHWTIISKPWFGYNYEIELGWQPEDVDAMPWLLDHVRAGTSRDFVAAFPQTVDILISQETLMHHSISIDLMHFQDVTLAAGDAGSPNQCVTMVCSYADRLGLHLSVYRAPDQDCSKDFALSAFRQGSSAVREAIEFQFLARGVLPTPVSRYELFKSTPALAQAGI